LIFQSGSTVPQFEQDQMILGIDTPQLLKHVRTLLYRRGVASRTEAIFPFEQKQMPKRLWTLLKEANAKTRQALKSANI